MYYLFYIWECALNLSEIFVVHNEWIIKENQYVCVCVCVCYQWTTKGWFKAQQNGVWSQCVFIYIYGCKFLYNLKVRGKVIK